MINNLAIITARGGSKRIPRKNIKEFMGKPMIAYAIQACQNSNIFDEIMVSTDDDEIANIARNLGAKVPFMRSSKNSDDYATTNDVLVKVISEYKNPIIPIHHITILPIPDIVSFVPLLSISWWYQTGL